MFLFVLNKYAWRNVGGCHLLPLLFSYGLIMYYLFKVNTISFAERYQVLGLISLDLERVYPLYHVEYLHHPVSLAEFPDVLIIGYLLVRDDDPHVVVQLQLLYDVS